MTETGNKLPKVIIQIPCFNEAETLPITLAALPRELRGIGRVEWLVVDDGSSDATAEVARSVGADHIIRLPRNRGLANAFVMGLAACVEAGADIVVNTDADNQYNADDIQKLIEPILRGDAEMVIGERPISQIAHFTRTKKFLQKMGSWAVRIASRTAVPDAPSGFRAFSRTAAMRLHVFSEYTYTLETIIQAGQKGMAVTSVPVRTNPDLRPSRLVRSTPSYIKRSIITIIRIFVTYRPFVFFTVPAAIAFVIGAAGVIRFLLLYLSGGGAGHVQSLILSALLIGIGAFLFVIGLIADLISVNRKLLERVDWRLHQMEERLRKNDAGHG